LHLQGSSDVPAGEHNLARALALDEAKVPVDLSERCQQAGELRAFEVDAPRLGARQVDDGLELTLAARL
jgi:hypothetical protein